MSIDIVVSHTATFILDVIRHFGYGGIVVLMAIESACIPVPSEIILTFSGYLVSTHTLSLWGVVAAGTAGSLVGSLLAYLIGASEARQFLLSYGRYLLISPRDMAAADRWFARHGEATVLIGRILPVLRTFISLPAGVARMRLAPFIAYTVAGSAVWCLALAFAGLRLGQNWRRLSPYMHGLDWVVVALAALFLGLVIVRHFRQVPDGNDK